MFKKVSIITLPLFVLASCGDAGPAFDENSRKEVWSVGSSTVFPFAEAVGEKFAAAGNAQPKIESTGTGAGIEKFCAGLGPDTPDIVDASRRMTRTEFLNCNNNGVEQVVELQIGLDGLVFAQATSGPDIKLTQKIIYEAIAANPYGESQAATNWSDVDDSLPATPIKVYGPPATSGTRDTLVDLFLTIGCRSNADVTAMEEADPEKYKAICSEIRSDGAYVESGEDDALIVQNLEQETDSLGIFGYSFLQENSEKLRGVAIFNIEPNDESIGSNHYPGVRPLYLYVKKAHIGQVPGLLEYVQEFVNAGEPRGYLSEIGLIPSSAATFDTVQMAVGSADTLPLISSTMLKN